MASSPFKWPGGALMWPHSTLKKSSKELIKPIDCSNVLVESALVPRAYKTNTDRRRRLITITYCSSSSVFMTNKTPNGARKHRESTQPNSSKMAKLFFYFLPSDGLAQYCVNLSRWFTHKTAAFSTEQCTTPLLFHNFEASQGAR